MTDNGMKGENTRQKDKVEPADCLECKIVRMTTCGGVAAYMVLLRTRTKNRGNRLFYAGFSLSKQIDLTFPYHCMSLKFIASSFFFSFFYKSVIRPRSIHPEGLKDKER